MAIGDIKNEKKAYTYTLFSGSGGGQKVEITGRLPAEWLVSVGQTWEGNASGRTLQEFGDNAGGAIGLGINLAGSIGGYNYGSSALANRQWSGGKPITFNLLAEFVAYSNVIEDVIRPVTLLQSMAMPSTIAAIAAGAVSGGVVFGAPYWETLGDSGLIGGKSNILLRIGEMYIFDDIIVDDVNLTEKMQLTEPGLPSKITAEIQVSTRGPVTFEQYVEYMKGTAMAELFGKGDVIDKAKEGAGQRAGYSGLARTTPTR